jgi:flagellar biosynthetic protein FliR
MLAPGFSSAQIPAQVRLFVAVAATFAAAPLLLGTLPPSALGDEPIPTLRVIVSELIIGASLGLLSRLFLAALETLSVATATGLGLANVFGAQFDSGEELPPLATFIGLAATTLIFVLNLHWEILRGLLQSYQAAPVDGAFRSALSLREIAGALSLGFRAALQVASPFIIYALIINFAAALINRLTPQIAIFYLSTPFVIAGGLALLYFVLTASLFGFMSTFSSWLTFR